MIKKLVEKWEANKGELESNLRSNTNLNKCNYSDLVKIAFDSIVNTGENDQILNVGNIHQIDDGDYQGTLVFLIPGDTYQPGHEEYLMTYVYYGSCSGCDLLQSIRGWGEEPVTDSQIKDYMALCKDIITRTIKPYDGGWLLEEYDELATA